MKQREAINEIIESELDKEIKVVSVQHDKKQFSIKIPKVFAEHWKLKKGQKVKLTMPIPEHGPIRKSKISMEIVEK
ncbi:MAG TPA: hypothetical protein ENH90_01740 [bacterium]|nr:hypothetical protein [bacterium]